MTSVTTTVCPYCDTAFTVEFDQDDDELMYCPACGEQLPDYEDYESEDWQFDAD